MISIERPSAAEMAAASNGAQSDDLISPTFAASSHHVGHSTDVMDTLQRQIKVKDKVIAELAGIIESLEINYGISIDDQTQTFQNVLHIANSMAEEAHEADNAASPDSTKGKYPD